MNERREGEGKKREDRRGKEQRVREKEES